MRLSKKDKVKERSLVSARGDEFHTDAYRRYLVGRPNIACFFLFLLLPFSIIFEIKNTQIRKFHFWKTVQIENLFTFEFHIQIQKKCSNSNLFRFKFVQTQICSDSNLFKLKFFSDLNLFKLDFVEIWICSNSILFKRRFLNWTFFEFKQIFEYEQIYRKKK
jgi:hypothetical protein